MPHNSTDHAAKVQPASFINHGVNSDWQVTVRRVGNNPDSHYGYSVGLGDAGNAEAFHVYRSGKCSQSFLFLDGANDVVAG